METQTHQAKASEADLSVGRSGHKVTAGFPVWEKVCVCCTRGVKQVTFSCCFLNEDIYLRYRLQSADNKAASVTLVISERQAGTTEMSECVARVRGRKTCDTRSTEGVLCSFTFWVCLLIITPLSGHICLPQGHDVFTVYLTAGLCINDHDNLHESQLRGAAWTQEKSTESFTRLKLKFSQMRYERLEPPHYPILDKWLRKWMDWSTSHTGLDTGC